MVHSPIHPVAGLVDYFKSEFVFKEINYNLIYRFPVVS
jgi:hypothetical protein